MEEISRTPLPMSLRLLAVATLALAALIGVAPVPTGAAPVGGLQLDSRERIDARLLTLGFTTPALEGPTSVNVLLPANYRKNPGRRYPVLYLLHGAGGNHAEWIEMGGAREATAGKRVIVVMPDGGGGYTDWYNGGNFGQPAWETYNVKQLVPWVDSHLRTIPERGSRAVVGLSMGGAGAFLFAARHPDMFGTAASFSGAVDINSPVNQAVVPVDEFGPRATQEVRWRGHNGLDLAENLSHTRLTLRTGNGELGGPFPGPFDELSKPLEQVVHAESVSVHERLDELGIRHVWDDYGPGAHSWPYWERDLQQTMPWVMRGFHRPASSGRRFTYKAIEPRYSVYGWRLAIDRPALEFSRLDVKGRKRLRLAGSGQTQVRSAPIYKPGRRYRVRVAGPEGKQVTKERASRGGRLRFAIDLGPGNPEQQYTAAAELAGGTIVRTARVKIKRLG